MTTILVRTLTTFTFTLSMLVWAAALPLHGQQKEKREATVTGRWTLNVQGGAHGAATMGLTLKQEGEAVTGTFASPHGDMPVRGEFIDGKLTLATVVTGDASEIKFTATLEEDDTLRGYVSSTMGDTTWTATRAKDK